MSDVQTGNETRLFLTLAGVEVEVAEILDLPELPAFETELYKTTHMTTGSIETHKKKPRKEGAEVTITGNYVIASQSETHLRAADAAPGPIPYRIEVKQGATTYDHEGEALFYNLKLMNPMEDRRTFAITSKWQTADTRTAQA